MTVKQQDPNAASSDDFRQALQTAMEKLRKDAAGRPSVELDMNALRALDALARQPLGEEQVRLFEEHLRVYGPLLRFIADALKKLDKKPEAAIAREVVGAYLRTKDEGIDITGALSRLLFSEELGPVLQWLQDEGKKIFKDLEPYFKDAGEWVKDHAEEVWDYLKGLAGIGIGVSGDVNLLIPGVGGSADVIFMFPYYVGSTKIPGKVLTRTCTYATAGIDIIGSAGIEFTFWFRSPVDSKHLIGLFLDIVPILGIRLETVGWLPETSDPGSVFPNLKANPLDYIFAWALAVHAGVDLGGGVIFRGHQDVGVSWTLPSLAITNETTKTSNVVLNQSADLDVVITWPRKGTTPIRIFKNDSEDTSSSSQLALNMPSWLSDAMSSGAMTITDILPAGDWSVQANSGSDSTTFNLLYTGEDNAAWNEDITFTIQNAKNNAAAATESSTVTLKMTNVATNSSLSQLNFSDATATLDLDQESFTGEFECTVTYYVKDYSDTVFPVQYVDDNGDTVDTLSKTPSDSDTSLSLTINVSPTSPPSDFQYLYYTVTDTDGDTPTTTNYRVTITDPDSQTSWYLGYQFTQSDTGSSAYAQAFWMKVGSNVDKFNAKYDYQSYKSPLNSTTQSTVTAYYNNDTGAYNLAIKATATQVYSNNSTTQKACV
jgi:hypothetical protein